MTDETRDRERVVFDHAVSLAGAERERYLESACAGQPELARRIRSLLAASDRADGDPSRLPAPGGTEIPERIGPYRLLEPIGEGGMGVVYLAEQQVPVRRRVALKLIKLGMDTREVIGRFESERQALALMSHPNIARILDASATEQGRPYFVMEYVPGIPITTYCARKDLDIDARLRLFATVCEAVQHAHQKGIIHRDLKPSNILVAEESGKPLVKVIDFGVAKATNQTLTERTVYTRLGNIVGTPEYLSPEQADLDVFDVDTRSDIYSLGVVLYELLTGTRPFEFSGEAGRGFSELQRVLREEIPSRPSTRGAGAPARKLRGELDWIVMRALEKDPARRYASAAAFAADVTAHLEGDPVAAGPPSNFYRLRKAASRHRIALGFVTAVVLFSVLLAVTMMVSSRRVAREAERANREAASAEQVSEFLAGLFLDSDPDATGGADLTARQLLDRGHERVLEELADEPVVQARLLGAIGAVYDKLGLNGEATPLLERAVEQYASELGRAAPARIDVLDRLAHNYRVRGLYGKAEETFGALILLREERAEEEPLLLADALNGLGSLYTNTGRASEAIPVIERALELERAELAPDAQALAGTLNNLAAARYGVGDIDGSAEDFAEAARIRERQETPDTGLAYLHSNLGVLYTKLERYDEAWASLDAAEALVTELLEPGHELVGAIAEERAEVLRRRGAAPALIEPHLIAAVENRTARLGEDHPVTGRGKFRLARHYVENGRYDEARDLADGAVRNFESFYETENRTVAHARCIRAEADFRSGVREPRIEEDLDRCLSGAEDEELRARARDLLTESRKNP